MNLESTLIFLIGSLSGHRLFTVFLRDHFITQRTFFIGIVFVLLSMFLIGFWSLELQIKALLICSVLVFVVGISALGAAQRRSRVQDQVYVFVSELLLHLRAGVGLREAVRRYSLASTSSLEVRKLISGMESGRNLPKWLSGTLQGDVLRRILSLDPGSSRTIERVSDLRTGLRLSMRLRRKVDVALSPAKVQAFVLVGLYLLLNVHNFMVGENSWTQPIVLVGHALFILGLFVQKILIRRFEWSICRGPSKW